MHKAIISNTVSNEDDNLDIRVSEPTSEEVNCVPLPLLTKPSIVLVNIGKVLTELVFVLTNVWFDWGKCCIAAFDADINVCGDCGLCLIESLDDDTNVCIEPLALPPSPTLIVNVPSCLSNP